MTFELGQGYSFLDIPHLEHGTGRLSFMAMSTLWWKHPLFNKKIFFMSGDLWGEFHLQSPIKGTSPLKTCFVQKLDTELVLNAQSNMTVISEWCPTGRLMDIWFWTPSQPRQLYQSGVQQADWWIFGFEHPVNHDSYARVMSKTEIIDNWFITPSQPCESHVQQVHIQIIGFYCPVNHDSHVRAMSKR